MAISKTRVKFLDKENKVLVKDLKSIVSNEIFSNIITPLLDSELIEQFGKLQSLLDLQENMQDLYNMLSDITLSDFSLSKILGGLNLTDPALAHIAATLSLIQSLPESAIGTFISTLLESTADKLYDNPSLVHNYKGVTNDVKTQVILVAIDVFGKRMAAGEIDLSQISRTLKDAAYNTDDLDVTGIGDLLGGLKLTDVGYDLDASVDGGYTLPDGFFDSGANDNSSGSGGGDSGKPPNSQEVKNLLIAYLTMKRELHKAYRRIEWLVPKGFSYVTSTIYTIINNGLTYLPREMTETYTGYITVLHTHDAYISYMKSHFMGLTAAVTIGNGTDWDNRALFIESFSTVMKHPYLLNTAKEDKQIYQHLDTGLVELKAFLRTLDYSVRQPHYVDGSTVRITQEYKDILKRAQTVMDNLVDNSVSAYYRKYKSKDPEDLCLPVLYTIYRTALDILNIEVSGFNNIVTHCVALRCIIRNLFAYEVGPLMTKEGFNKGDALLGFHLNLGVITKYPKMLEAAWVMVSKTTYDAALRSGDVDLLSILGISRSANAVEIDTLPEVAFTNTRTKAYMTLNSILRYLSELSNYNETGTFYSGRNVINNYYTTVKNYNKPNYCKMPIDLDRIQFSVGEIKIT